MLLNKFIKDIKEDLQISDRFVKKLHMQYLNR